MFHIPSTKLFQAKNDLIHLYVSGMGYSVSVRKKYVVTDADIDRFVG